MMSEILLIVLCVFQVLIYRRQKKYYKDFLAIEDRNRHRWGDTWTLCMEHEQKLNPQKDGDRDG